MLVNVRTIIKAVSMCNSHKELTINRHAMHVEECVIFYYILAYKLTVSNNDMISFSILCLRMRCLRSANHF